MVLWHHSYIKIKWSSLYLNYNSRYTALTTLSIRQEAEQIMANVFIQRFQTFFFYFCHVFTFFNVFLFFLERFFTSMVRCRCVVYSRRWSQYRWKVFCWLRCRRSANTLCSCVNCSAVRGPRIQTEENSLPPWTSWETSRRWSTNASARWKASRNWWNGRVQLHSGRSVSDNFQRYYCPP